MIRIRAFRAIDDLASCERYIEGHRSLLESYGLASIVGNDYSWKNNPGTYVIIVENTETGKTLGGTRIQIRDDNHPLPLEDCLKDMDETIVQTVQEFSKEGTAEFCGLWNSREVAGLGIGSVFLVRAGVARAGVAIAKYLNVKSLFALCASYTLPIAQKAGFVVVSEVGEEGAFPYPNDSYRAIVAVNKNIIDLENAIENEKDAIIDLRENPMQERTEVGPRGETKIIYDLKIHSFE